ncbi:hypothetical protein E5S67_04364 [Microcoleus sp. IPMA8]|uniref:Uncharacterized protein n=1 Tax=Microcoleus asticus IPMA8 TaxID=2563858 RepID=A0ABX2D1T0_9CYAN|nr:hypothetical protein [Microcoleus asticus IPMA8]
MIVPHHKLSNINPANNPEVEPLVIPLGYKILYPVSTTANNHKISRSRILSIAANAAPPPTRKSPLQKVAQT